MCVLFKGLLRPNLLLLQDELYLQIISHQHFGGQDSHCCARGLSVWEACRGQLVQCLRLLSEPCKRKELSTHDISADKPAEGEDYGVRGYARRISTIL